MGVGFLNLITPASVIQIVKNPVAIPAEAASISSEAPIIVQIERTASKWGIASSTLYNLVKSESNFDPLATSTDGHDRGLVQISNIYHPEVSDAQAFDSEFALNFAAEAISANKEEAWVSCNCVQFVKAMGVKLPRIIDAGNLDPNTKVPVKGGVIIMVYNGIHHLAYIDSVQEDGIHIREANYSKCLIGRRVIPFNDPATIGFYTDKE